MNLVHKIERWGDDYHAKWTDIIRMVLGLFIMLKGITFIGDTEAVQSLLLTHNKLEFSGLMIMVIVHYIVFAHVVGGLFLMIGLLTRFSAVIQIPILLGAVFFVNIAKSFTLLNSELWLSIIVLLLLIMFWVIGSGPYSVDHEMKMKKVVR
jgi:putative oxidoreductase